MKQLVFLIIVFGISGVSSADMGTKTCIDKKMYLRDICKNQVLNGDVSEFSDCANGFTYQISTQNINADSDFITSDQIGCKMVEIRKQDGIESRTSYFDQSNQKVVVYQHENGLANAYVYGHTGYYHITKFASGDSIFNFHSFDN
jgi:uncharacterized membrane protein